MKKQKKEREYIKIFVANAASSELVLKRQFMSNPSIISCSHLLLINSLKEIIHIQPQYY